MNKPQAAIRVREKLHSYQGRCPFCGVKMMPTPSSEARRRTPNYHTPPDTRSRAHLHARNSPKDLRELWVYGCCRCNTDQGHLSLDDWLLILHHRKDRRAALVDVVVKLMVKEGIL